MDDSEFMGYIDKAVLSLPLEFREKMDNVSIFIEDFPKSRSPFLLGLYEGIPQNRRGHYGIGPTLPDRITIFKYPILAVAQRGGSLAEIIRSTVLHEIGHHFGLNEEEIRRAEAKRKRIKP